eukprot:scaffold1800_cov237-Pinguiococcus_pyrenoidosus.AAC.3
MVVDTIPATTAASRAFRGTSAAKLSRLRSKFSEQGGADASLGRRREDTKRRGGCLPRSQGDLT